MQKIEPRPSVASKKALWAKRIPSCFWSCFCFFSNSLEYWPKNCPDESSESEIQ